MTALLGLKRHIVSFDWKKLLTSPSFYYTLAFWTLIFFIFFLDAFHESYPDEFDNLLGGWYILHGRLPYIGFFTHHGPASYFVSSIVLLFSGHSFVHFRVVYNILLFIFLAVSYLFLRKQFGSQKSAFFPAVIATLAVGSTYFWSQMLLADNVSAFCLLTVYAIIFLKEYYKKLLTLNDIAVISILTTISLLSSLTYLYLALGIYLFLAFSYIRQQKNKLFSLKTIKAVSLIVIPYIIFGIYLISTKSTSDYLYQSITFNQKYYIYNYPGSAEHINPIRFAIVIAHTVIDGFITLLVQVKDFNLQYPLNITLAVGDVVLLIYLFFKGYRTLPLFLMYVIIYANARSNPLLSAEHDYQSATYIFVSILNICFVLPEIYKDLNNVTFLGKKIVFGILFGILGLYAVFTGLFFVNKFNEKYYPKYMGTAPRIYDNPELAPIINKLVSSNEYVWVGPFEFQELFYVQGKLASRYHILNPGMGYSDRISSQMVMDIEQTKPKIIWFNPYFSVWGKVPQDYATAFIQELSDHYVVLYKYKDGNKTYKSLIPKTQEVDLDGRLYIRKEDAPQIIAELLSNNMVQEVSVK